MTGNMIATKETAASKESAVWSIFNHATRRLQPALPVLRFLLTPVAVLAGTLSVWRLAADAGWTNSFFIADGFLSYWQLWFAIGIGIQMSAWGLNRRVAVQKGNKAYNHDQQ